MESVYVYVRRTSRGMLSLLSLHKSAFNRQPHKGQQAQILHCRIDLWISLICPKSSSAPHALCDYRLYAVKSIMVSRTDPYQSIGIRISASMRILSQQNKWPRQGCWPERKGFTCSRDIEAQCAWFRDQPENDHKQYLLSLDNQLTGTNGMLTDEHLWCTDWARRFSCNSTIFLDFMEQILCLVPKIRMSGWSVVSC